jgi:hypothetical protein
MGFLFWHRPRLLTALQELSMTPKSAIRAAILFGAAIFAV